MRFHVVTLIYDGDCGFCVRSLAVVRALDAFGTCRYQPAQDDRTSERFPMLRSADLIEAMYAVTDDQRVYRGFFAFRRVVWNLPLAWPLLAVFYFPGASVVGPVVYRWIARNRGKLGCASSCSIPAPPSSGPPSRVP